jgi:hypothetical protein
LYSSPQSVEQRLTPIACVASSVPLQVTTGTANNGRQLKTRNSYATWSQQGYHCCRFYSELQFALRQVMKQAPPPNILTFTCKETNWSVMLQICLLLDVFSWHSLHLWSLLSSFSTPALIATYLNSIMTQEKNCWSLCSVNRTGQQQSETTCFQICPSKAQNAKM